MVGYSYVQQLLWELLLLAEGNYLVMELREITTTILLASDNSRNNVLLISSIIILQLTPRLLEKTLYLVMTLTERQFVLVGPFIFTVPLLVSQREALFQTPLSMVFHCKPMLWHILLLVISILP